MTTNEKSTKLADLLTARTRAWIYAVLALVTPAVITTSAIYGAPKWLPIIESIIAGAGFIMAGVNTPTNRS